MIQVSEAAAEYIGGNARTFQARIMRVDDNEVLSGTIRSLTICKGSCDSGSLVPGAIFSGYADAVVDNCEDTTTVLTGATASIQMGVRPLGGTATEWYTVGTYRLGKPSRSGNRTTLSMLGAISARMGRKYESCLNYPCTVFDVIDELAHITGTTIRLADNLDPTLEIAAAPEGYYCREALALVAGLYFGYATELADGTIQISTYNTITGTLQTSPGRMRNDPELRDRVEVQGVQIMPDQYTSYQAGNIANASIDNPLMSRVAFDRYNSNYVGFAYVPHSIELTLGDFRLEPSDVITLTDRSSGTAYDNLRCMSIRHTYDGGIITTVSAPDLDEQDNYYRAATKRVAEQAYKNGGGGGSPGSSAPLIIADTGILTEDTHTLSYTGVLQAVYLNGLRLLPTEYTSAGSTITFEFQLDAGTTYIIEHT